MFAINALGFFDNSSDSNAFENSFTLLPSQDIVSIPKDLNFFSIFPKLLVNLTERSD